jgi:hypothetical protein
VVNSRTFWASFALMAPVVACKFKSVQCTVSKECVFEWRRHLFLMYAYHVRVYYGWIVWLDVAGIIVEKSGRGCCQL